MSVPWLGASRVTDVDVSPPVIVSVPVPVPPTSQVAEFHPSYGHFTPLLPADDDRTDQGDDDFAAGDFTAGANADARWTKVSGTPGCYFFSGPAPEGADHSHGRRARLVVDGHKTTLRFGDATFTGRVAKNGQVTFRRDEMKTNEDWSYTERISGTLRKGTFTGRYRYEECELNGQTSCIRGSGPHDYCRINAHVRVKIGNDTPSSTPTRSSSSYNP